LSFRKITAAEIEKRLETREVYNLIFWDGKPRLSMAGVQDKLNVFINPEGEMGFGDLQLPTFINAVFANEVKQSSPCKSAEFD
jgi:hypothetical protein